MSQIKDFTCTYDNSAGISDAVTKTLPLHFPDAYFHADTMAILSKALKAHDGAPFCTLPFCHTVEAEAMGGQVNFGDGHTGPRASAYICQRLEDVLELPAIDFSAGRIQQVLLACRQLHNAGERVVLEISGPLTILNGLVDIRCVFRAMRKDRDLVRQVFAKLGTEILRYATIAKEYGVDLISYADSAGGVNILGPKVAEQIVHDFTAPFVRELHHLADQHTMILLCPKTTFALLGTNIATLRDISLPQPMRYGEACCAMIGKVPMAGQMCIKNINYMLQNCLFKEVVLQKESIQ